MSQAKSEGKKRLMSQLSNGTRILFGHLGTHSLVKSALQ